MTYTQKGKLASSDLDEFPESNTEYNKPDPEAVYYMVHFIMFSLWVPFCVFEAELYFVVQAGLELPEVFLHQSPVCWDYRLSHHARFNAVEMVVVVIENRLKRVGWGGCGSGKGKEKDARHDGNVPHCCCISVSILAVILQLCNATINGHWAKGTQHLSDCLLFFPFLFSLPLPSSFPPLPPLSSFSLLPLPIPLFP